MAVIRKCTGGEAKAMVRADLPLRVESFYTDNPPIELEAKELVTPTQGSRYVNTFTTYPYGAYGRSMQTSTIFLPIQHIYGDVQTHSSGGPITFWRVIDAMGQGSTLGSTQAFAADWQWGAPVRFEIGPLAYGLTPVTSYALEVKDQAGRSQRWMSDSAPIPWEHYCGCKPGFRQCGDFPFNFCCLDCARINSQILSAQGQVQGAIGQVESLLEEIKRHTL